ncbi:peptidylprolyl isomerase [Prochlorococcus sp. MIT 1306]|uniref:peptidylprolyl isomerase n=2 Tax=Prochlorococcus sp. MIT 1306 TaxID=1799667 RepID=UPI0039B4E98A
MIQQIALHGLLEPMARAQAEIDFIRQFELPDDTSDVSDQEAVSSLGKDLRLTDDDALKKWRSAHLLKEDDEAFIDFARIRVKRKQVINELLKGSSESLFLRYKDRLDRVLYSLIRVESEDQAYSIYYSIDSGEVDFGMAAEKYSCGPEAKTQGIVGPVDLTTPHPEVAARLRTAQPRQIFEPFIADNWHAIIRLEYRFDSELDDKTKEFLGGLVLGSKSRDIANQLLKFHLSGVKLAE